MIRREFLLGLGVMAVRWGEAADEASDIQVQLETVMGAITLNLAVARAPLTTRNFVRYVTERRYDGASFYRASRRPDSSNTGLIQGGILPDSAEVLAPIPHESTILTGLSHQDGTISMARYAPGTATCHFFICVGDMSRLDARPGSGDGLGFAAFGHVAAGMDIVRKILTLPTSPTAGEGVMRGQMLEPPVTILHARLLPGAQ